MTDIARERMVAESVEAARARAVCSHLVELLGLVTEYERPIVAELLSAWLEISGAGAPMLQQFGDLRDDAGWWADSATPLELESYVGAGLRRIERAQFADAARKRIFVALWEGMGAEDRKRFLTRVDPEGKFVRRAA